MINKLRRRFILVAMLSTVVVLIAIVGGMNIMNYRQLQADADRTNKMITDNNGTFPNNNGGDRNAPKPGDDNQGGNDGSTTKQDTVGAKSDSGNTDQQNTTGKSGNGSADQQDTTGAKSDSGSADNRKPDGNQPPEPPQGGKQNGGSNPGQPGDPGKQPSGDMGEMSPEAPFETRYFSVVLDASGKVTSTNLNNIAAVSEDQAEELAQKVMKAGESNGFIGIYRYAKAAQSDGTLIAFTDCNKALDTFYKNMRISGLVSLAGVVAVFILVVIFSRLVFRPVAESYQKQKQFITDASHEIKTPLTIIDANVEVIEMMSGENKWTKSTKNQVKRLASLAGQLITLSKMDEGDGMADKMRFSMTDAVIDTASSFESVAETRGRKLVCDIEENLYYVGEEKRIREMFGIFLDNAVKYSTEGSEIHVSLERKGRKIIYQISNETDQIAKGNQDVLFERFYRSDASRNSATGGSGIGLSVAKAVAEAHHGKLTAESKDGKSLTIMLTVGPVV